MRHSRQIQPGGEHRQRIEGIVRSDAPAQSVTYADVSKSDACQKLRHHEYEPPPGGAIGVEEGVLGAECRARDPEYPCGATPKELHYRIPPVAMEQQADRASRQHDPERMEVSGQCRGRRRRGGHPDEVIADECVDVCWKERETREDESRRGRKEGAETQLFQRRRWKQYR